MLACPTRPAESLRGHHAPAIASCSGIRSARPHGRWPCQPCRPRADRPGKDVPGSEPSPAQARTGYGCPIPLMSLPSHSASRAPRSCSKHDRLPSLYIYAWRPSAEMRAHAALRALRSTVTCDVCLLHGSLGRYCELCGVIAAPSVARRSGLPERDHRIPCGIAAQPELGVRQDFVHPDAVPI